MDSSASKAQVISEASFRVPSGQTASPRSGADDDMVDLCKSVGATFEKVGAWWLSGCATTPGAACSCRLCGKRVPGSNPGLNHTWGFSGYCR